MGFYSDSEAGKLPANSPRIDYLGPKNGPFRCDNCRFFAGNNKPCAKVSDPVESGGCCNKFRSKG